MSSRLNNRSTALSIQRGEDSNQLSKKSIQFIQNTSEIENQTQDQKMSGQFEDGIPKGLGPNQFIGPNKSDLYTLKLNDTHYDQLFTTVKGILNKEMKNPNIEKMHLLNSIIKHKENDQIERMKNSSVKDEPIVSKKSQALQKKIQDIQAAMNSKDSQSQSKNMLEKIQKFEKHEAKEKQMKNQQLQIENILNRYNKNHMTYRQASNHILSTQINKWAKKIQTEKSKEDNVQNQKQQIQKIQSPNNRKDNTTQNNPATDKILLEFQNDQYRLNRQLEGFSKIIFQLWDKQGFGKIKMKQLVFNIISFGLIAQEEMAINIFQQNIIKNLKQDASLQGIILQNSFLYQKLSMDVIKNVEIELEEFLFIFKGDEHQQKILDSLNREALREANILKIQEAKQQKIKEQKNILEKITDQIKNLKNYHQAIKENGKLKFTTNTFISKLKLKVHEKYQNENINKDYLQNKDAASQNLRNMLNIKQETSQQNQSRNNQYLSQSFGKNKTSSQNQQTFDKNAQNTMSSKDSKQSRLTQQDKLNITAWNEYLQMKELQKEYRQLVKEYQRNQIKLNRCQIDEIRIDQNDSLRASILANIFNEISINFRKFQEDLNNLKNIKQFNQEKKLEVIKSHKEYKTQIKNKFCNEKAYKIFCEIMKQIVELQEIKEKNYLKIKKETEEQVQIQKQKDFDFEFKREQIKNIMIINGSTAEQIEQKQLTSKFESLINRSTTQNILIKLKQQEIQAKSFINYGLEPERIISDDNQDLVQIRKLLKAIVTEQYMQGKKTLIFNFPNQMNHQFLAVIDKWWNKMDPQKNKIINFQDFCELMVKKRVVSNSFDVITLVKESTGQKLEMNGTFMLSQYYRFFSRAFLRGSLINLWYCVRKMINKQGIDRFPIGDQTTIEITDEELIKNSLLHVLKLQRNVVIKGLKNQQNLLGFNSKKNVQFMIETSFEQNQKKNQQQKSPNDQESNIEQDIDLLKQEYNNQFMQIRKNPYYKQSLRGIDDRQKRKQLKENVGVYRQFIERFEDYQELLKNAAVYGSNHQKTKNILLKREQNYESYNQIQEEDEMQSPREYKQQSQVEFKKIQSKVDLTENKISYKIAKLNLEREIKYLDFLDGGKKDQHKKSQFNVFETQEFNLNMNMISSDEEIENLDDN